MNTDRLRELLDRLEGHWVRQGAPVVERLRPGLSDAEIRELAAGLPFEIPPELRCWWGWHDGAAALPGDGWSYQDRSIGIASYAFLPLADAVKEYRRNREIHPTAEVPEDVPKDLPEHVLEELRQLYWHESWLPVVTRDASRVYADCAAVTAEGAVPVGIVHQDWENFLKVRAPSFTDAVAVWVHGLDEGVYRWDRDTAQWEWDHAAVGRLGYPDLL